MIDDTTSNSQSTCPELLKNLSGNWFVLYSNFPMWTKGKRKYPMFHYSIERREREWGLADKVTYTSGKKKKQIIGFDTLVDASRFMWRGNGWLTKHLTSQWQTVHIDADNEWAIIHFEKTFFTPAGYDVISRSSLPSDIQDVQISEALRRYAIPPLKKITQKRS